MIPPFSSIVEITKSFTFLFSDSLLCSGSEDEDEDDIKSNSHHHHHHHGSSTPEANNNSLASDVMTPLLNCDSKTTQDDSEDQG